MAEEMAGMDVAQETAAAMCFDLYPTQDVEDPTLAESLENINALQVSLQKTMAKYDEQLDQATSQLEQIAQAAAE